MKICNYKCKKILVNITYPDPCKFKGCICNFDQINVLSNWIYSINKNDNIFSKVKLEGQIYNILNTYDVYNR